jgi:hypothetical protein
LLKARVFISSTKPVSEAGKGRGVASINEVGIIEQEEVEQ